MLVGFWGRPKLVLAIVPAAVGAMLFDSSQRCRKLGQLEFPSLSMSVSDNVGPVNSFWAYSSVHSEERAISL